MRRPLIVFVTVLIGLLIVACDFDMDMEAEMLLNVADDGSSTLEFGIGSAIVDEDGAFLLDCSEIDPTEAVGPASYMNATMRGDMVWCNIITPFADLKSMKYLFIAEDEEDLDEEPVFQCLALEDGVFYLDMFLGQDVEPEEIEEGIFPFVATVPGPILYHNAETFVDNSLTWNLSGPAVLNHLRINMEKGDPCPVQGMLLNIVVNEDGSSRAQLTIPLPTSVDDAGVAAVKQIVADEFWRTSVHGDEESGYRVVGARNLSLERIAASVKRTPGIERSSSSIILRIDDGDPLAVEHKLELNLNMASFAGYWADVLPDEPTPGLTVRLVPAGEVESAVGDWLGASAPLLLSWDPASSPNVMSGKVVSIISPAPPPEAEPIASNTENVVTPPVAATDTVTETVTVSDTETVTGPVIQPIAEADEALDTPTVIVTDTLVATGTAILPANGTSTSEPAEEKVEDVEEELPELTSQPAIDALDSYEVSIEQRLTGYGQDSLTLYDSVHRRTDGRHGFDYGGEKRSFDAAGIGEYAYYVVDELEAWLDNGLWNSVVRGDSPTTNVLAIVDYKPYESMALDLLETPYWTYTGADSFDGIPVHHLALRQSVPSPTPYAGLYVVEADVYIAAEDGYVISYSLVAMSVEEPVYPPSDDVLVLKIDYELNRPNEVQAVALPRALQP